MICHCGTKIVNINININKDIYIYILPVSLLSLSLLPYNIIYNIIIYHSSQNAEPHFDAVVFDCDPTVLWHLWWQLGECIEGCRHLAASCRVHDPWRIHGAGIYADIKGVNIDGIHVTIYGSTMDPSWVRNQQLSFRASVFEHMWKSMADWILAKCCFSTSHQTGTSWSDLNIYIYIIFRPITYVFFWGEKATHALHNQTCPCYILQHHLYIPLSF